MVTTTDVLGFQQKLADSMAARTLAVTDHALPEASQQRAQGTLLEHYGAKLEGYEQQARPWWASFRTARGGPLSSQRRAEPLAVRTVGS